MSQATDRIEKRLELKAPIARVWRAVSDYQEFGAWFRVKIDGPFVVGEISRGRITYPGYEHMEWEAHILKLEPQRLFAFTWPHYDAKKSVILKDARTLVEFRLEKTATGTLLMLTESGFDKLPDAIRLESFRGNEGGWTEQMTNIEAYVAQNP